MTQGNPSSSLETRIVRVDLGPRSYDVRIGRGLLEGTGWADDLKGPLAIVTDQTVSGLYAERLEGLLKRDFPVLIEKITPGEGSKSLENVAKLLSWLARNKVPRTGTVIGLGGGVVGDLAGYVAASYLRGVAFVQIPTTLLAMVDSSVGGKTGVNLPEGKNLVGAFHQPKRVVVDLGTLRSFVANDPGIPGSGNREFAAGMAEVIKYGAIRDAALFDRVAQRVMPHDADLAHIVETCVSIKARIVENDEFETKGERALLNFGHTLGHAIEKAGNYARYLHGEAIALGMRAAAWLSVWQTGLPEAEARRIEAALQANGLPVELDPTLDRQAVLAALGNDKKVAADGGNRWVLLRKLGAAESGLIVSSGLVEKALDSLREEPAP